MRAVQLFVEHVVTKFAIDDKRFVEVVRYAKRIALVREVLMKSLLILITLFNVVPKITTRFYKSQDCTKCTESSSNFGQGYSKKITIFVSQKQKK